MLLPKIKKLGWDKYKTEVHEIKLKGRELRGGIGGNYIKVRGGVRVKYVKVG